MCLAEAIAGAQLVMGVVGAMEQSNSAKAAADAQNQAAYANAERANAAAVNEYNALQKRLVQEGEARTEGRIDQERNAREAISQATAATAEGGISGLSVNALLADYARIGANNKSKVDRQYDMTTAQIEEEKKSVKANAESRIASVPTATAPGLNIASISKAALGAFETYDAMDMRRPKEQRKAPWNRA